MSAVVTASIPTTQHLDDDVLMTEREVRAALGNPRRTTFWALRRQGRFPEPVQLRPGGRNYWRRSVVRLHIASLRTV